MDNVLSETLKSVLLFRKKLSFVTILFTFLLSSHLYASEVVTKDVMVMRIAQTVFTLDELKNFYHQVRQLKCYYPETLLYRLFEKEFSADKKELFNYEQDFSAEQKAYFKNLLNFGKLYVYSKSQNVVLSDSLPKILYFSAKKNKCTEIKTSFESATKLNYFFKEILKMEVFVRSRFLVVENATAPNAEDIALALKSAWNLIKSIEKQIDGEAYWLEQ